jgi:hypothetical protein
MVPFKEVFAGKTYEGKVALLPKYHAIKVFREHGGEVPCLLGQSLLHTLATISPAEKSADILAS